MNSAAYGITGSVDLILRMLTRAEEEVMERSSDFCLAAFLRLPEHFFNIGENLFTKLHCVIILTTYSENTDHLRKKDIDHEEKNNCDRNRYDALCGLFTGCGKTEVKQDTVAASSSEEGKQEGTAEEKELTGTIDEIKDFMFVVTDANNTPYSFTFEEKPEGLENVSSGDTVTVTYTERFQR